MNKEVFQNAFFDELEKIAKVAQGLNFLKGITSRAGKKALERVGYKLIKIEKPPFLQRLKKTPTAPKPPPWAYKSGM